MGNKVLKYPSRYPEVRPLKSPAVLQHACHCHHRAHSRWLFGLRSCRPVCMPSPNASSHPSLPLQMLMSNTNGGMVFVRAELDKALFDRLSMNPSFM